MASPPRTRTDSSSSSSISLDDQENEPDVIASLAKSHEDDASKKENNTDVLPLKIGNHLLCLWRDGNYHPVKIIHLRKLMGDGDDHYEYYVCYTEFDGRVAEWVNLEQLDLSSLQTCIEEEANNVLMTHQKNRKLKQAESIQDHVVLDVDLLVEHENSKKLKSIKTIEMGRYEMETCYNYSLCEPAYDGCTKLYFCEFCLNVFKRKERLQRHLVKCELKHPPGSEIYRNGNLVMFEVVGKKNHVYCENLCVLAKLFLGDKARSTDVKGFLFYILFEFDDRGYHMVSYFSKEKNPVGTFNVSCLLTLPPYQKNGYGRFLIAFSYELSKKEGKVGTPEWPLSDLGWLSYMGYWTRVILGILIEQTSSISIKELSELTAIEMNDITDTLDHLDLMQYKKGQHTISLEPNILHCYLKAAGSAVIEIDRTKLIWAPYQEEL